jgi:hypothetical protein
MKVRVKRRPLFRWLTGVEKGTWCLCMGPRLRYPAAGVVSARDALALQLGDAEMLERDGLQWFDPLSRERDWQKRWRSDWPLWMWPTDARRVKMLVLELADRAGVTPRLATNRYRRPKPMPVPQVRPDWRPITAWKPKQGVLFVKLKRRRG